MLDIVQVFTVRFRRVKMQYGQLTNSDILFLEVLSTIVSMLLEYL